MIEIECFKAARARVKNIVVKTELSFASSLSELRGYNIFLKK